MSEPRPHLRLVQTPRVESLPKQALASDVELLALCAAGDDAAATAFVLRHQGLVHRFLSRMLGASDPSVDDLAQKTFLAALRSSNKFDGRSTARTWLLGIANNQAKMQIRGQIRRRKAMELLATLRLVQPPSRAPDIEASESARRIQAAVLTLNPNRRAAFVLCEVQGMTAPQASAVLDAPEGTVRRWRAEARAALQSKLRDLIDLGEGA
ncbi:MAG: RNA polymerase sigma-70 factor (ECF subfamily) [Cognaticolwellia sp.]|jgi:RNA polymerase sigma-70 factor (ECF subfamily)